jgi:uncharacterized protein
VSSTTKRKPAARASRRRGGKPARAAAPARKTKKPSPPKRPARTTRVEQPLGMGVGDGFAVRRLKVPSRAGAKKGAVREIGWAAFGDISRALAARIGESFLPDAVLGIAKGGVFVGGALSAALDAEFFPVRLEKRRRDHGPTRGPAPLHGIAADGRQAIEALAQLPDLRGKRVLVVDDVAASGATLARARALARKAGGREVKTAVLVVRHAGARPDWAALETDDLVLFAWDYHLHDAGGGGIDPGEVGV